MSTEKALPVIKIAGSDDVRVLFDIRNSVSENYLSREDLAALGITPESVDDLLRTAGRAWIAMILGDAVAFSMADSASASIKAVFVRPGFEGRGLGRALLHAAESWLFEQGAEEIWLTTGADPDLRSHGFYARLGWIKTGLGANGEMQYAKKRGL